MDNINFNEEKQGRSSFLVGRDEGLKDWVGGCPWAKTLTAYSLTLECYVILAMRCKRWGCKYCGPIKVNHYAQNVEKAKPTKLITLTVDNKKFNDPREAYEQTSPKVSRLAIRLRRIVGEFEYFRVTESTKIGWPHYHLVARTGYIKQAVLSNIWAEISGAYIVDIRKIDKAENCYWYIVKYLGKQNYIAWTKRRCSWTRNFMANDDFVAGESLDLLEVEIDSASPQSYINYHFEGKELHRYSMDMMTVGKPKS